MRGYRTGTRVPHGEFAASQKNVRKKFKQISGKSAQTLIKYRQLLDCHPTWPSGGGLMNSERARGNSGHEDGYRCCPRRRTGGPV